MQRNKSQRFYEKLKITFGANKTCSEERMLILYPKDGEEDIIYGLFLLRYQIRLVRFYQLTDVKLYEINLVGLVNIMEVFDLERSSRYTNGDVERLRHMRAELSGLLRRRQISDIYIVVMNNLLGEIDEKLNNLEGLNEEFWTVTEIEDRKEEVDDGEVVIRDGNVKVDESRGHNNLDIFDILRVA
jgi:hypothetical protein